MICILGKTASGKDTIVNRLISEHSYKKMITFTTRPMRQNEKQGVTYHFISEEDFLIKVNNGFFAEWKSYKTEFGVWYYGTSLEDLNNTKENTVIILTPDGYRDIIKKMNNKPKSIYINANDLTIKQRLIDRGDNKNEAQRRLEHDNIDFKDIENEVDLVLYNNQGTDIEDIVTQILKFSGDN